MAASVKRSFKKRKSTIALGREGSQWNFDIFSKADKAEVDGYAALQFLNS